MSALAVDNGLLFVYSECGPAIDEAEFIAWTNKHGPARLAVPGISSAARYKTTDGKAPTWLGLFDATSPDVLQSDKAPNTNASAEEKSLISRMATVDRRVYSRFATVQKDGGASPSKFTLVVGVQPTPENEEDVNRWYEEEHLGLMAKVPGFIRARRYKLVSASDPTGKAGTNNGGDASKTAFPYVTLYDWENDTHIGEPEFKEAISTPRAAKALSGLVSSEVRLFALDRDFSK